MGGTNRYCRFCLTIQTPQGKTKERLVHDVIAVSRCDRPFAKIIYK